MLCVIYMWCLSWRYIYIYILKNNPLFYKNVLYFCIFVMNYLWWFIYYRLDWDYWVMMGMIGFLVGALGFFLHQFIDIFAELKWVSARAYIQVKVWNFLQFDESIFDAFFSLYTFNFKTLKIFFFIMHHFKHIFLVHSVCWWRLFLLLYCWFYMKYAHY